MFILIPPGFLPERTALAADLDSPLFGSPEIGTKEKDCGWEAWIRTRIPCSKGTCPYPWTTSQGFRFVLGRARRGVQTTSRF